MVFLSTIPWYNPDSAAALSRFHSPCFLFPPSPMLDASFSQQDPMQKCAKTTYLPLPFTPINEEMTIAKEWPSVIIALENIKDSFVLQA